MNQQQYGQPPQPIHGYQGAPHPANYNGNQQPSPSNISNQMGNLSLNNDIGEQKPPLQQALHQHQQQQQQAPALKSLPPQIGQPLQNAQLINQGYAPNNNIPVGVNQIPAQQHLNGAHPPHQQFATNGVSQQLPSTGVPNQHYQPQQQQPHQQQQQPQQQQQQQQPTQAPPSLPPSAHSPSLPQQHRPLPTSNYGPPQPPASNQQQNNKFAPPSGFDNQPRQANTPLQPNQVQNSQFQQAPPPLSGQLYQQQQNAPLQKPTHIQNQAQSTLPSQQYQQLSNQNQAPGQQQFPPLPGQSLPPLPGQSLPPLPGQPQQQRQQYQSSNQQPFPGQNQQQTPFNSHPPMPGLPHMPPPPHQQANYPPIPQNNFASQQQAAQHYPPGNLPPQPNRQYASAAGYNQASNVGQYPPGMAAPAPQRRLDPDQMPNPIQVMSENQRSITAPFVTNEAGLVPPLVTTKYVTHDQGNSGPRFIRSTMYNVPATPDMIKQTSVPFSLIISPFARTIEGEIVPPIVNFGELGPIRCVRCKAYMSPNMQFVDAGRRFRCALCKATTDVPSEYFQHLDHAGQRVDKYERPELVLGTYEFVATKEYCRDNKPSKPPAFIFVIDVSYNNIKSGLVHLLCKEMKEILKNLPIDQGHERSQMKVGFITYNNTVHFYNVKENLAQPQMMVVGDVHEMFMPLLDGFFCDPDESSAVIDALMEQIPIMFGETRETETILLPALQAGLEAIKASECAGKLLVFHSSLPVSDAPGKLLNREDRKLLGTEKEKVVLAPQNNAYNNLGQDCVLAACSVDLFIFNNSYIDLATIGQVARLTGGEIYKYTYFQADIDGPRVINDVIKNISRPIGFEAVMRVRTSAGIRPTEFYGHFFMSNTTDLDIASIACDKSIGIEIKHDDKLPPEENVYIQVAILYTSCSGQRRIRILNLALKTCVQMADLFRCCDLDAMVLYFAKQIMYKLLESTPRQIRDGLEARCAQILACYRKNCASPTSAGQLILPECMKLLPLYLSCLTKNDALSGGSDMSCDDRSYVMQFVLSMDLPMSVFYFYPRLIPIHDVNPNDDDIPSPIRCTIEKLAEDGAYILENGIHLFVWLGLQLAPEFTQAVFGAQCSQQIDTDRPGIPILENPLSKRVRHIIDSIQAERPRYMRVTVIRQRDKLENVLRHFLIEDRSGTGAASYVDYLCHLHKEIRAILS